MAGRDSSQSSPAQEITPDFVRVWLSRILKSGAFLDSERLRRLLTFLVEESLAGRADKVTEYALALDVLDRKSTRLNSSHSRASRMPSSA